jgi:hypothetical protein
MALAILAHHKLDWSGQTEVDDAGQDTMQVLDIYGGHSPHTLKTELTDLYAATAAVCMERHHTSPTIWSVQMDRQQAARYQVPWADPTEEDRRSYNDCDEATEFGACGLVLAAADLQLGLVAYARAKRKSGVDFYLCLSTEVDAHTIASYDLDHFETVGLEVSGIDRDDDSKMNERVRRKVTQIRNGNSPDRAVAGVAGFLGARVVFRTAKP